MDGLFEDITIEKEEGGEGLVFWGRGDVVVGGQVGQGGFDLGGAHFGGVALVVEEGVTANPVEVLLFGAVGIVA